MFHFSLTKLLHEDVGNAFIFLMRENDLEQHKVLSIFLWFIMVHSKWMLFARFCALFSAENGFARPQPFRHLRKRRCWVAVGTPEHVKVRTFGSKDPISGSEELAKIMSKKVGMSRSDHRYDVVSSTSCVAHCLKTRIVALKSMFNLQVFNYLTMVFHGFPIFSMSFLETKDPKMDLFQTAFNLLMTDLSLGPPSFFHSLSVLLTDTCCVQLFQG